jgi:hypothetical protein
VRPERKCRSVRPERPIASAGPRVPDRERWSASARAREHSELRPVAGVFPAFHAGWNYALLGCDAVRSVPQFAETAVSIAKSGERGSNAGCTFLSNSRNCSPTDTDIPA